MEPNVVAGEVRVSAGAGAGSAGAPTAPLEEILKIADGIWKEARRANVSPSDKKGAERLLDSLRGRNRDFATSFPVVLRWMVEAGEYSQKPFKKFLQRHVKPFYKDRKDFLHAQGEYLILLYRHRRPRAGARQLRDYRRVVEEALKKDDEDFSKAREEADEEVKKIDAEAVEDRRRRLYEHFKALAESGGGAPPPPGRG